jgi:hypothetical protein
MVPLIFVTTWEKPAEARKTKKSEILIKIIGRIVLINF